MAKSKAAKGPSPPSAAQQVLGTMELLEMILLNLDDDTKGVKTLLLSLRVNKTFRDTIEKSQPLQEALWMRTARQTPGQKALCWNPLMGKKIKTREGVRIYVEYDKRANFLGIETVGKSRCVLTGSWRKMLVCRGEGTENTMIRFGKRLRWVHQVGALDGKTLGELYDVVEGRLAVWRRLNEPENKVLRKLKKMTCCG